MTFQHNSSPSSSYTAAKNYARSFTTRGSARTSGSVTDPGAAYLPQHFVPGGQSPAAAAAKIAQMIMDAPQRRAAREAAANDAQTAAYERNLNIQRMENQNDPTWMSGGERARLQIEQDKANAPKQATPVATRHFEAGNPFGAPPGDYSDSELSTIGRNNAAARAHQIASHVGRLGADLNAQERSVRQAMGDYVKNGIASERRQLDANREGALTGNAAALKALGVDPDAFAGAKSDNDRRAMVEKAHGAALSSLNDKYESDALGKFQPKLDQIHEARLKLISMGAKAAGVDWNDEAPSSSSQTPVESNPQPAAAAPSRALPVPAFLGGGAPAGQPQHVEEPDEADLAGNPQ